MDTLAGRQVILLPFPFSDLTDSKLRPALVLASAGKGDWVLCQITSRPYADPAAVILENSDFSAGGLQLTSYARPGKLFTAHQSLFRRSVGRLTPTAHAKVVDAIITLLKAAG